MNLDGTKHRHCPPPIGMFCLRRSCVGVSTISWKIKILYCIFNGQVFNSNLSINGQKIMWRSKFNEHVSQYFPTKHMECTFRIYRSNKCRSLRVYRFHHTIPLTSVIQFARDRQSADTIGHPTLCVFVSPFSSPSSAKWRSAKHGRISNYIDVLTTSILSYHSVSFLSNG